MRFNSILLLSLFFFKGYSQKTTDTLWQKQLDGYSVLGMLMADGSPIITNDNQVSAINPETGEVRWQTSLNARGASVGYYRGTPYLEVNGAVINPVTGALLNMGQLFKTGEGKSVGVKQSYIFPQQNIILIYGTVNQGVVEDNVDEIFSVVEYRSGKTLWIRKDLFKTTAQKPEKKGLGGFMKQAGTELTKGELQRFDDAKNPGERILTSPLVTNDGNILLPLNNGLFAVDSKTGNVLWKKEYAVKKKGMITTKTSDPTTVLAFNNDSTQLYISRADFTESINVKTGDPLWKNPMPSAGPASFLYLSSNGLLSLPTKEATVLQNRRISLFDANTGEVKWDIKQKFGVQSYIQFGDTAVLNLQNAGDKESINLLLLSSGNFLLDKNIAVEGNVLNMKSVAAGVLVITDKELSIINKKSGEKTGSISKKKDQSWILTGNKEQLFVIVSGTSNISKVDYSSGEISNLLSEKIDFKGGENPTKMEWYNGHLLVSSEQNICNVNVETKKIQFQKYYKAPGRSVAGKILSGTGAALSFSVSVISAGSSLIGGMVTGGFISSDMSTVCYDLFPEETNAFVTELLESVAADAKLSAGTFKEGVRNINAISKRFKDTRTEQDHLYMLSTDAEGDPVIIQVSKKNGELMSTTSLRKRDKEPDFLVDELGKSLYYIPKVTLSDEFKAVLTNKVTKLIKLSLL